MQAKKSLGQNFLTSKSIAQKIARLGEKNELILEIGPGKGILTEQLLEQGSTVIAIEKDARLIEPLTEKFSKFISEDKFRLIEGDILDANLEEVTQKKDYAVVANIPYYITGAIIKKLLSSKKQPNKIVILVQKEVAERIVARNKKESILSLSVKAYGDPSISFIVKAGSFSPPPKVDSAVLVIGNISRSRFNKPNEEAIFFNLIKAGFSSKRKKLSSNIKHLLKELKLYDFGVEENARAEDLNIEDWLKLSKKMYQ